MQVKMMQHKRSLVAVNHSTFVPKRLKIDAPLSSKEKKERVSQCVSALQQLVSPYGKEKKERVSQRVSALQQLVSPYGKTDTASVLLEAMEYINFLHEQVKVLSAPYLCSTQAQIEGEESCSLRAKGLCLVPTCLTLGAASSNGADIWAPIKTSPPNSRRSVSDEAASVITYC